MEELPRFKPSFVKYCFPVELNEKPWGYTDGGIAIKSSAKANPKMRQDDKRPREISRLLEPESNLAEARIYNIIVDKEGEHTAILCNPETGLIQCVRYMYLMHLLKYHGPVRPHIQVTPCESLPPDSSPRYTNGSIIWQRPLQCYNWITNELIGLIMPTKTIVHISALAGPPEFQHLLTAAKVPSPPKKCKHCGGIL